MNENKKVRTRFAPSPTGYLHVGGARTALFSYLFARHCGGEFLLRIEDTDRARSTQASIDAIIQAMDWLGLDYDEGPIFQTQRFERYQAVLDRMLDEGLAYYCDCSKERLDTLRNEQMAAKQKPRYDGCCRYKKLSHTPGVSVIRFANPTDGAVAFTDLVRGDITVENNQLDDLVIARSDGVPTYNFTVVVDDADMQISHVIRGDDHINNTPRQINLFRALGWAVPEYAHVPSILGGDGKRLSKRHGAVSVMQYQDDGYLSAALVNYLVRLGWAHGDQEIFSVEQMKDLFTLEAVSKSPACFSDEKLQWVNQHYLKSMEVDELEPLLAAQFSKLGVSTESGPALSAIIEMQRERCKDLVEMAQKSRYFFEEVAEYDEKAVKKQFKEKAIAPLTALKVRLENLPDWNTDAIGQAFDETLQEYELKLGKLAQPLRVALTGAGVSPSIDATLFYIGQHRAVTRIENALRFIEQRVTSS